MQKPQHADRRRQARRDPLDPHGLDRAPGLGDARTRLEEATKAHIVLGSDDRIAARESGRREGMKEVATRQRGSFSVPLKTVRTDQQ